MNTSLNIAQLCPSTAALGPGNRFVIWVQGCPFDCKGCVAQNWIPFKMANAVDIPTLTETIISQPDIRGITISGGEPMMQARNLVQLLQQVREKRPALDVIIFTGFTLKQLVWDEAKQLLTYADLLIDGQYIDKLNDQHGLRGSSNQQFNYLTDRLLPYKTEIETTRTNMEFHLLDDGVLMVGIPPPAFNW